jgi:hypothetical protein
MIYFDVLRQKYIVSGVDLEKERCVYSQTKAGGKTMKNSELLKLFKGVSEGLIDCIQEMNYHGVTPITNSLSNGYRNSLVFYSRLGLKD